MGEADRTTRRLAAILAADVVGYSRMMSADEAGTLAALKRHRERIFDPAVAAHRGRIVKLIGDGTLVEFLSVVDAVECGLAIQRATADATPLDGKTVTLRIGINLGDIIVDGDDIYGDGVNVAARLEALAAPGGVCVSAIVNEIAVLRVDARFEDGGEVSLKNIDRPIRVWRWRPGGVGPQPASADSRDAPPPERAEQAAIAVLPFDNMSGDPEQDYFSDGISEDIITDLSKVAGLLVIARNSSFAYKGRSVDIRSVGRELGVTAVLEGSIRRAGNRVRITAQLIDAISGTHLWAERYDRDLIDIFAVQDDVTRQIVEALEVTLSPPESARIAQLPTTSIEAYDLILHGREALLSNQNTREMFEYALDCFNRAIELDPDYAEVYACLAHAHNRDFQNNWTGRSDSKQVAAEFSCKALEKGPELPYAHYVASVIAVWDRDLERARTCVDTALALNPNLVLAIGMRGIVHIYAGSPLDALPDLMRAQRLDPLLGHLYWHFIGSAYLVAGHYQDAADAFNERIRLAPDTDLSRGLLIASLGHLGEFEAARQIAEQLKAIKPVYQFERHIARLPFSDPADADRIRAGYAKAGLSG